MRYGPTRIRVLNNHQLFLIYSYYKIYSFYPQYKIHPFTIIQNKIRGKYSGPRRKEWGKKEVTHPKYFYIPLTQYGQANAFQYCYAKIM